MPWLLASSGLQRHWYRLCRIGKFLSYLRRISITCVMSMWRNGIKWKRMCLLPLNNLASVALNYEIHPHALDIFQSTGIRNMHVCIMTWGIRLIRRFSFTLYLLIFFQRKHKHVFTFYVIPPHCHDTKSWNPSSSKTRIYLFYIANIVGADI